MRLQKKGQSGRIVCCCSVSFFLFCFARNWSCELDRDLFFFVSVFLFGLVVGFHVGRRSKGGDLVPWILVQRQELQSCESKAKGRIVFSWIEVFLLLVIGAAAIERELRDCQRFPFFFVGLWAPMLGVSFRFGVVFQ